LSTEPSSFLEGAAQALAGAQDEAATLKAVAQAAVPHFADGCTASLMDDGKVTALAVATSDPELERVVLAIAERYPFNPSAAGGIALALRTGKPLLLQDVAEGDMTGVAQDPRHLDLIRALGARSALIAPLLLDGTPRGALVFLSRRPDRRYTPDDVATATTIARLASLAVTNARLLRRERAAREAADEAREEVRRLHADLVRRADEFTTLLDLAPVGIAIAEDPECRVLRTNRYFADRLGVSTATNASKTGPEAERLPFRVCRNGEEIPSGDLPVQRAAATGKPVLHDEHEVVLADGRVVHLIMNAAPVFDDEGRVRGVIGASLDITDRKLAETALRASEVRFRSLLQATSDMVWTTDRDGLIVDMPEWRAYTGQTVEEVRGFGWADAIHPEDRPGVVATWNRAYETRSLYECEYRVRAKDGTYGHFHARGVPILDGDGNVVEWIGTWSDVTARKRAEEALREREAYLRALTEAIPAFVWTASPEGRIEYVNAQWAEYTGIPVAEGLRDGWARPIHPKDLATRLADFMEGLRAGRPTAAEHRVRGKDGEYRWFLARAAPVRDAEGRLVRWGGSCTDIHDWKTAVDALQESEERLRLVTSATNEASWDWNLATDENWWSRNLHTLFGYEPEEVEPTIASWKSRIHPEDHDRVVAGIHAAMARGEATWSDEYRFRRADGSYAIVYDRGRLLYDEEGRPLRAVGAIMDITERRAKEEAVRESEARFRLLAKATNDTIWDWDCRTNLLWWNENFTSMFGYSREEVEPTLDSWTNRIHPDDRERVESGLHGALERGEAVWMAEYRFLKKDGTYADILDRGHALYAADGSVSRMVGSMMDLTERKRAEAELEASRRELVRSEKLSTLGTLVSGVAHEVRTPLTYIANNLFLIRQGLQRLREKDPALAEAVAPLLGQEAAAREGVSRINNLVGSLRQVARQGPGRLVPQDLAAVARGAVDLFESTERGRLQIAADLLPTPPVPLDREQIQAVILNLLRNASEALPLGGKVRVRTRLREGSAEVEVEDSGPGIPPEVQPHMFEPFYTTKKEGTGLGLAICRRIVEAHGGSIRFTTVPGRGTTFTVALPLEGPLGPVR
ncbi:MAG TPA: PAS domain-containing protein, partial [Candidatus Thermoplasmatota archaeon]|nr:PAS domain-containing protein [Candidatus Thermoplasmatota archaeon]